MSQLKPPSTLIVSSLVNVVTYSSWTLLNKLQFSPRDGGGLGVVTPLFVTGVQMLIAGAVAATCIFVLGVQNRNQQRATSGETGGGSAVSLFSVETMRYRILPLGLARSIDIGCANAALVTVSVAVQQVIKSLLPLFVTILSVTLLHLPVSPATWVALIPVVSGTILATLRPPSGPAAAPSRQGTPDAAALSLIGVMLATFSCLARAFKAVLNAKLLQPVAASISGKSAATAGPAAMLPLEILLLEAPTSGVFLIVISLILEHRELWLHWDTVKAAGWLNIVGGVLMFFNQWSYITVIEQSSAVTCQVIMNMKMLLLILVSIRVFDTPFTLTNLTGVIVAASGCILYASVASRAARLRRLAKDETDML